jgi:trehalose-6-phosphatase
LTWFETALAAASGKKIVMFLDYDGTLSPIVEDPDRAVMSEMVSNFSSLSFWGNRACSVPPPAANPRRGLRRR